MNKVRDFIGEVSRHSEYEPDSSRAPTDLGRLKVVIKKMALGALRP